MICAATIGKIKRRRIAERSKPIGRPKKIEGKERKLEKGVY
jgi:hypothetical protein